MASRARLGLSGLTICVVTFATGGFGGTLAHAQESAGYRIDDPTVIAECSSCHARDDEGRLSRISYLRKTPEGWQASIQRMMGLHGVRLEAEYARAVVSYLANEQGLAPEELRPGLFEVERRRIDYDYPGDSGVEFTCIQCHSMGRVITQRRTNDEWALLLATHRALYPLVDFQAFRRAGGDDSSGAERHPMDEAIEHLSEVFPLETPEWSAWAATRRVPRLAGEWMLTGYEPGKGVLHGRVTIATDPADPSAFTTRARYVLAESGQRVERAGQAVVYTGYQWRGRSNAGQEDELREVMFVERDLRELGGRWFAGSYDELGPDVTLRRVGSDPAASGVYPAALERGGRAIVTVYGANLEGLTAADFDLGEGVAVTAIEDQSTESARLQLDVAAGARVGARDLYAAGSTLESALVVHDGLDRIVVTPETGLARVGGGAFPKAYQTFEAIGWDNGPDGEPDTDDDLSLGRVDVSWSVEEYAAVYGDDDIDFVGSLRQDGTFEPALDGPNPVRSGNRNNIGDVWVVATHRTLAGRTLAARAHLVVTVPLYMRFDPWVSAGPDRRPVGDEQ
jgi:quinohemoprotein amine dehydrogenase